MEPEHTNKSIRITALLVATLANFLTPFMSSAVNIALPAIGSRARRRLGGDLIAPVGEPHHG